MDMNSNRLTIRWGTALLMAVVAIILLPAFSYAVAVTDVVELFKYTYGVEKMVYLASVETVVFNLLKKRKKVIGGRGQWIIPFQTQNAGVLVGMSEGGTLTTKRAQPDTAEATHSLTEFQAVWDITWKMLRQAAKGRTPLPPPWTSWTTASSGASSAC
jgi:hypothetical protein